MPPLLCVKVRRAIIKGPGSDCTSSPIQFNTFVRLQLDQLRIETQPVHGQNPNWEQNFIFQTAGTETGLLIELWNKGAKWSKLLGYIWITLDSVVFKPTEEQLISQDGALASNPDGYLQGTWYFLDAELLYGDHNQILGTARNTEHMLLISCYFQPSIDEHLAVDQYHLVQQQQIINHQQSNDLIDDLSTAKGLDQLNLPKTSNLSAGGSNPRLISPYLFDPQTSPFQQLAVAACAEAERTGVSPTVATCTNMPITNLYKSTVDPSILNQFASSSENERTDQTNQITSTESDSQDDEQLERLATRFRTKRGISLLDELIMANDTAAEWLIDQLCALDEDDVLSDDHLDSSDDDLLLLDGK